MSCTVLQSLSVVDVRKRWYFYMYSYFRMLNDPFLKLYKIFLMQGLNCLPQGLVKQQIFALLQESLTRLDSEACSLMSFLGCILLHCCWGFVLWFVFWFCGFGFVFFFSFLCTGTYRIFFHQVMNIIHDKQSLVKYVMVVCLAFPLSLSVCLS